MWIALISQEICVFLFSYTRESITNPHNYGYIRLINYNTKIFYHEEYFFSVKIWLTSAPIKSELLLCHNTWIHTWLSKVSILVAHPRRKKMFETVQFVKLVNYFNQEKKSSSSNTIQYRIEALLFSSNGFDKSVSIRHWSVIEEHSFFFMAEVLVELNKMNNINHCYEPRIGP